MITRRRETWAGDCIISVLPLTMRYFAEVIRITA
jgi:hypothetical protein